MVTVKVSQQQIDLLVQESKPLPADYQTKMRLRPKRGHKERELDVVGQNGNQFQIRLRQSLPNPLAFSVILAWRPPESNELFRLRRYNGRNHEHTNDIEQQTFYAFHIHQATERYQAIGAKEDAYAEPTDGFADIQGAIRCMLEDCGFNVSAQQQRQLL